MLSLEITLALIPYDFTGFTGFKIVKTEALADTNSNVHGAILQFINKKRR